MISKRNGVVRTDRTKLRLHDVVFGVHDSEVLDHRDGDQLNNRRRNLRPATIRLNVANGKKRGGTNPRRRYKGIVEHTGPGRRKRWQAHIKVHRHIISLGYFLTQEEAARAYDAGAREHFGEFACTNFPRRGERRALG